MLSNFSSNLLRTQKLSKEEQNIYNHRIIDDFIESVNEMNDVVLIPSKLQDIDANTESVIPPFSLNDDLYQYYQMINAVKNDLFDPNHRMKIMLDVFEPKRKISRQQRREEVPAVTSTLTLTLPVSRETSQTSMSTRSSSSDLASLSPDSPVDINNNTNGHSLDFGPPKSSQLTEQFSHHLHCMYEILEHFTQAADFITEKYILEVGR